MLVKSFEFQNFKIINFLHLQRDLMKTCEKWGPSGFDWWRSSLNFYSFYKLLKWINSYACGTAPRGRLTFKDFFRNFPTVQSFRPITLIPAKKTFAIYSFTDYRQNLLEPRKKLTPHWPFGEFCPKIEIKSLQKFQMTIKIPETFMECLTRPWN